MSFDFWYHRRSSKQALKSFNSSVKQINQFSGEVAKLTDEQIREQFLALRGLDEKSLNKQRAKAFSLIREASARSLAMRHFDVQLFGGLVLDSGMLAEMATGEGKTLVITLAAAFNSLKSEGVHVVTVNPYLAQRDCEAMRPLYEFLGLTVAANLPDMDKDAKRAAYQCDITYCVNYEVGFDYLRDNMATHPSLKVMRGLPFAIVDEVDSVLIDEARTPLIISGASNRDFSFYTIVDQAVRALDRATHFEVDEKQHQVVLNDAGYKALELWFVEQGVFEKAADLYSASHFYLLKQVTQSAKAHFLYFKDKDYVVLDNKVVIVDTSTGRPMPDRQWSDGLHQAVQAKEGVEIQSETETQATITYQRFFGMYKKLAGLTGTAMTEAEEFIEIYGLRCVSIPTNKPIARVDMDDRVFSSKVAKRLAILEEVKKAHAAGQPVLIGTASVEESEALDQLFRGKGFVYQVLNAKQNETEAQIIAEAGLPGAVTIATNMAGRGTDIVLGGHIPDSSDVQAYNAWKASREAVLKSGGLFVIGTERHESRRIDNQLRGRAGRQGDVGRSVFMVSLEDHLLRVFGGPLVRKAFNSALASEGEGMSHPMLSNAIKKAQMQMESIYFDSRKNLMKYDEPLALQRFAFYRMRDELMENGPETKEKIWAMVESSISAIVDQYAVGYVDSWDLDGLNVELREFCAIDFGIREMVDSTSLVTAPELIRAVLSKIREIFDKVIPDAVHPLLIQEILKLSDSVWTEHLTELERIKMSAGLTAIAQKNPVMEYTHSAFELFKRFRSGIESKCSAYLISSAVAYFEGPPAEPLPQIVSLTAAEVASRQAGTTNTDFTEEDGAPLSRLSPCPCGSGKRFKHCHGSLKNTVYSNSSLEPVQDSFELFVDEEDAPQSPLQVS